MARGGDRGEGGGTGRSGGRRGWSRGRAGWGGGRGGRDKQPARQTSQETSQDWDSTQATSASYRLAEPRTVGIRGTPGPYLAWDLYFPNDPYSRHNDLLPLIQALTAHLTRVLEERVGAARQEVIDELNTLHCPFRIDCRELVQALPAEGLDVRLREQPEECLACLGVAAAQAIQHARVHLDLLDLVPAPHTHRLPIRLLHFEGGVRFKELKANLMGKLVVVKGTVVRISSIKPILHTMTFLCRGCGEPSTLQCPEGKYQEPTRCNTRGCASKLFLPDRSCTHGTRTVDWQRVRLQEKLADDQVDSGRIPRTVECEVTQELVDLVVPGDVIQITGIVKVVSTEEGKAGKRNNQLYLLYIETNSLAKAGQSKREEEEESAAGSFTKDSIAFSTKELYGIREIWESSGNLFQLLVHSLCPPIFGHLMVKAGLLLALFGGRRRYEDAAISIRSDCHVLICGDPGLGKSQLLTATCKLAPRGVYITGNSATTSGLTVTMSKDPDTGETGLEAGALILADQGVCCIDEFDKLAEHNALLEAMEQQSISIAKAGLVCSLPARSSVIAAANPVGGHYNKAKTVSENLKMNPALLSRFDLVFILLDDPDAEMDRFLSEHIMKLHSGGLAGARAAGPGRRHPQQQQPYATSEEPSDPESLPPMPITLADRLKQLPADATGDSLIPPPLLRKYIAYAKKYTAPELSPEAAHVLQTFYLRLRSDHRSVDATPITTRQLESMIRLAEARARAELRSLVTAQDAQDVVEIMQFSLWETYKDGRGAVDFSRSQHGTGMSGGGKKGEYKRFIYELSRIADHTGNSRFTTDNLYQVAKEKRIKYGDFPAFIDSLNNQGYLLKKGHRIYQLATVL